MKLLSIVIPSYNAEKWMADCLESLLFSFSDKLEIIVVNDGSTDKTSDIAHQYSSKYDFIKVIDKENGGHGSGINVGLINATGLYFKVLDSDDHLDKDGLLNLINYIEKHLKDNNLPDVYVADYVSVCLEKNDRNVMSVKKYFNKVEEIITPDMVKKMPMGAFMLMHSVYVKTELLKNTNMHLIEKTFYEDNQFLYHVVIHAHTYFHLDKEIYLYTVGRKEQSIALSSMMKNYQHQLRVLSSCVDMISYDELKTLSKGQQNMIIHVLFTISYLNYFYVYIGKDKERKKEYKKVLKEFKNIDRKLYNRITYQTMMFLLRIVPPFMRAWACTKVYEKEAKKKGWAF